MNAEQVAVVFAALGEGTRLSLLRYVLEEEHCVSQCTLHVGLTQGAVSKQLGALTDAGLLTRRRAGRRMYYRVKDPTVLTSLLTQVQTLVDRNCPVTVGPAGRRPTSTGRS